MIVTVTGKMCSGKSTVLHALQKQTSRTSTVLEFGDVIRSYANKGFEAIEDGLCVDEIADRMGIDINHASEFRELVIASESLSERTPEVTKALQRFGSVWCNEVTWANRLYEMAIDLSEEYDVVLVGGCRLKVEHDAFNDVAFQVRLDISEEVQKQRCIDRDGYYDIGNIQARSETEIDNEEFDLRLVVDALDVGEITRAIKCATHI